uniref:TBC1 domain family member 14-like n=1 Tax=Saccoglossus kowalevskii TaxID=10224 RepID=A0ABM0H1V0_SACKO|nr:PREDICTED: TBC1 domain family member 14-like [Saccoglossus kowalevskii]
MPKTDAVNHENGNAGTVDDCFVDDGLNRVTLQEDSKMTVKISNDSDKSQCSACLDENNCVVVNEDSCGCEDNSCDSDQNLPEMPSNNTVDNAVDEPVCDRNVICNNTVRQDAEQPSVEHAQDVDDKPESERYEHFVNKIPDYECENWADFSACNAEQVSIENTCGSSVSEESSNSYDQSETKSEDGENCASSRNSSPEIELEHLQRSGTRESFQSDASITSVSSISTEPSSSISAEETSDSKGHTFLNDTEAAGFVDVSLHTRNSYDPATGVFKYDEQLALAQGAKPKKKGLSGFLSRSLFAKKSPNLSCDIPIPPSSPPGWKLFGRVPSKETPQRPPNYISEEYQAKGKTHPPTTSKSWKKRMSSLKVASSTTALILENRPQNLPAKSPEEEQKHKQQYQEMIACAKKKEIRDAKQNLKKMAEQVKYEDNVATNLLTWNSELLPHWENVKHSKKTRDIWWNGVPPGARGKVWLLAIGNELNITHELFEIFKARAKTLIKALSGSDSENEEVHAASKESSVEVIKLDVNRTFPQLCIFQKGGPYYDMLSSLLGAYACYRPDVGYVQGMSFIAAVFLLNLEPADAFICFANLLNKPCQMAFFRLDEDLMKAYFATYEEYFEDNLPDLFKHFHELNVTPDLYIIDWMYTLYGKSLPLDVACRVWDVFFRDGEEFLFRTALGILHEYQEILLNMDFIHIAQFLTKLPEDIAAENLFTSIAAINLQQKKFGQVFLNHLSTVQSLNNKE